MPLGWDELSVLLAEAEAVHNPTKIQKKSVSCPSPSHPLQSSGYLLKMFTESKKSNKIVEVSNY
jgi:hypothetical protein